MGDNMEEFDSEMYFKNMSIRLNVQNQSLEAKIRKLEHDRDKLINYIAVRENKDYEDIRKEFDI